VISSSQRPLPDNTHDTLHIHAPVGIRTHDRSRPAAVDLRLRPRGYWDRQPVGFKGLIFRCCVKELSNSGGWDCSSTVLKTNSLDCDLHMYLGGKEPVTR
jgi:hypothetical protein